MAITRITKGPPSSSHGSDGVSYTVQYSVVFDVPTDPALARVASFNGVTIPRRGDKYPKKVVEPDSYCTEIEATPANDTATTYRVIVKYGPNNPLATDDETPDENGDDDTFVLPRTKVRRGTQSYTFESDKDRKGRKIANSAGVFYQPLDPFDDAYESITITNYMSEFDDVKYRNIRKKCNSSVFMGRDPYTLLIDDFQQEPMEFEHKDGSITDYHQLTFTLLFNKDGWKYYEKLDHGTEELEEELPESIAVKDPPQAESESEVSPEDARFGAAKKVITDAAGQPVASDIPLNGKGKKLGEGEAPVFIPFVRHDDISFYELGIEFTPQPVGPRNPPQQ